MKIAIVGTGIAGLVAAHGVEFRRMWEFYFCYCEAGFLERAVTDAQLMLAGPRHRTGPGIRGGVPR